MENTHIMTELEVLKSAMTFGFVKFVYNKKDGSERVAIGTRNVDFIEQVHGTPKGEDKRDKNPLLCTYYDLTKGAWRCFRTDLFKHMCFGTNGEENLTKEDACTQALALALNDTDTDIQGVMVGITALIGTTATTKLSDYVCGHKDEDLSTLAKDCLESVFNIIPTNQPTPTRTTTQTSSTATATATATASDNRLADLVREELRLKDRLAEIEREKRSLLGM